MIRAILIDAVVINMGLRLYFQGIRSFSSKLQSLTLSIVGFLVFMSPLAAWHAGRMWTHKRYHYAVLVGISHGIPRDLKQFPNKEMDEAFYDSASAYGARFWL